MPETWPGDIIASEMRWGIETNSLVLESQWTRGVQAYEMQGARWRCEAVFRNLAEVQQRKLGAFIDFLRGPTTSVNLPVWIHDEKQGNAGGTVTVTLGTAHSKTLNVTGLTGDNPMFVAGDLINVDGRLYKVLTDADRGGEGNSNFPVAPPLRSTLDVGASVTFSSLVCPMRLVGDSEAVGRFRPKPFGEWTLSFVEVLP